MIMSVVGNSMVPPPVLWTIRTVSMAIFVVFLGYLYDKDKDKRKLMFILAGALAFYDLFDHTLSAWLGLQMGDLGLSWFSMPLAFAVFIAAFSSFLKWKESSKPFKAFLVVLGTSIGMLVLKGAFGFRMPNEPMYASIMASSYAVLVYIVVKRKEIPDVMFLLAQVCFMSAEIGVAYSLPEFTLLASFFSLVFTVLMFATSKYSTRGSVASIFALKRRLKQTQRKLEETEEQLLKAERLGAIGQLAAMVGHDLRNPLTGIAGATYYLKRKNSSRLDAKSKEMLEIIEKDIEYSNKIINDLLDYSREIKLEIEQKSPRSIVEEALSRIEIPVKVEVANLTENEPIVKVDSQKIVRTFVNLIRNALDAMPKGGTLTIRSSKASNRIEISFNDTGTGMSKETIERIWTPLFTTKAKGMGFGLAISKRFIEAHGGKITVDSAVGQGTTFTIALPLEPKVNYDVEVDMSSQESQARTN
jgi:signal transduction histidine kinase